MNSNHFKKGTLLFSLLIVNMTFGCKAEIPQIVAPPLTPTTPNTAIFAKGGDISFLPAMESSNFKFYNDYGIEQDCFQILKDHDFNAIRLRTWVNPSRHERSGRCSKYETIAMAVRAKSWGMRVMINFHYSDTWADPGKQAKPAAWENLSFPELLNTVYEYTHDFMVALDSAGVTPEWVQVGNEIPSGMLYPDGKIIDGNFSPMVQLINKGYEAIKAVSPNTKVVLHIDQGNNNARFRWWFDNAKKQGAKYDVIGMSYYPYHLQGSPDYSLSIDDLGKNLLDMASRYGKEVMVVETGGLDTEAENTKNMLTAVIKKVLAVPNNAGLGVLYWEPQVSRNWGQYPLSAWGRGVKPQPTVALDAFLNPVTSLGSVNSKPLLKINKHAGTLTFKETLSSIQIINLNGVTIRSKANSDSISVFDLAIGIYVIHAKVRKNSPVQVFKYIKTQI